MIALTAATLFTPVERIERPLLLLEDGVIREVSSQTASEIPKGCRVIDFGDGILAPGLIDIHIHGAAGRDLHLRIALDYVSVRQSQGEPLIERESVQTLLGDAAWRRARGFGMRPEAGG